MAPADREPSDVEDPNLDDERGDVEDDAVIESALRKSLLVFIFAMLPIIGILLYVVLTREKEESVEVEVRGPTVREQDESKLPETPLVDVTQATFSGLPGGGFVHRSGRYGEKLLPETMGGGVAVFDYNNDGNQDVLFVNSMDWPFAPEDELETKQPATCRLFAGDGQGGFRDVSEESGMNVTLYGMGAAVGDYDNDGDVDVFLSAVGPNRLMRNDNGKFVDVTDESGVAGTDAAWNTSCGFLDYDNDGLLDLFVCSYVQWSKDEDLSQLFTLDGESRAYGPPKAFSGSFSFLYHNDGDGKFTDVSESAGIQIRNSATNVPLGKGMGVAPCDFNRDGWMDIIVANDTVRNFLFENKKDGTFAEKGQLLGIAYDLASGNARGAMGIDTTAFRDDGSVAIGIGNFANEASALYLYSKKRRTFVDAAMFTGFGPPTRQGLTFGLFFFDVDLDGRPDVLGANGHLEEEISKTQRTQQYAQRPQLFWNAGKDAPSELVLMPEDCTGESFCEPIVGRGAACGDFDNDGDQDVVIVVSDGPAKLFRNDQETGHHWLRFKLTGTKCNQDAIGATVTLKVGDETRTLTVMPTRSYLSQCELPVTFGLGTSDTVTDVTVTWPGGETQSVDVDSVDRTVEVTQE